MRARILASVLIALAASGAAWMLLVNPGVSYLVSVASRMEDRLIVLGRKTPVNADLVFVGIDAASLEPGNGFSDSVAESRGLQLIQAGWPWSREVYAVLAEKLFQAGARVVIFDLLFGPDRDGDSAFRAVLDKYRDRILVGINFDRSELSQEGQSVPAIHLPNATLLDHPDAPDPRVGFVNFWPEQVGGIRATRFRMTLSESANAARDPDEPEYLSLAGRALQVLGHPVPAGVAPYYFRFQPPGSYRPLPVKDLLDPATWKRNYGGGEFFAGKVVIVGPAAEEMHDVQTTPIGDMDGPRLHLHALAAALRGEFYQPASLRLEAALVVLCALIGMLPGLLLRHRPLLAMLCLLAGAVAWFGVALALYDHGNILAPVAPPMLAMLVGGVDGIGYEFGLEQRDKARVRRIFESYVSQNVARAILDDRDGILQALGGTRKPMALLFSDLRGFTAMSEQADPVRLVAQLNEYLGAMVDIVFRHDGTLDKFIGDAVMGVWGNLTSSGPAGDACKAVETALDMRAALPGLNAKWRGEERGEFAFGVGVNHGDAVFGNIGSERKKEPTAIGDAVNLASRLEGLTKFCGVDIVLSDSVEVLVREHFRLLPLGAVRVSGRAKPVGIFWPVGRVAETPEEPWMRDFSAGLAAYRARDFAGASECFLRCTEGHPGDPIRRLYLRRCAEYAVNPPGADWDGSESAAK